MTNIYNPLNDQKPPTPPLGNVGIMFSRLSPTVWGAGYGISRALWENWHNGDVLGKLGIAFVVQSLAICLNHHTKVDRLNHFIRTRWLSEYYLYKNHLALWKIKKKNGLFWYTFMWVVSSKFRWSHRVKALDCFKPWGKMKDKREYRGWKALIHSKKLSILPMRFPSNTATLRHEGFSKRAFKEHT